MESATVIQDSKEMIVPFQSLVLLTARLTACVKMDSASVIQAT